MGHSATTCKPPLAMDATQKPMVARGGRTLSDEILVLVGYKSMELDRESLTTPVCL